MRSGIAWALLAGCGARWTPSATDSAAGVQDLDGDGYIATAAGGEDCDDLNPSINPAGTEICDGRDDDCDGRTDEADADLVPDEWAADADGDGYGDPDAVVAACEAPADSVGAGGAADCDDSDPAVHPRAQELCDPEDTDEDCDGLVDDQDPDVLASSLEGWLPDADGDGYGDPAGAVQACDAPEGYVAADELIDCDDADPGALACVALAGAARLDGLGSYAAAGSAVSAAGDVDGDGERDLLVGAPGGIGGAWLVPGPFSGDLAAVAVALTGASDQAGYALAGPGDLDGDGLDDVLVGAWRAGSDAGALTVLYGPVQSGALADAPDRREGAAAGDLLGVAVAGAGDVDGDGLADALVGASAQGAGGAAWLLSGPILGISAVAEGAVFTGEAGSRAGAAVAGPGDLDGDGLDDVVVGAPDGGAELAGAIYLLLGPVSGAVDAADADAIWSGDERYGRAGSAVSGAGDVDGDGAPELLVGQPRVGEAYPGVSWLVSEPLAGGGLAAAGGALVGAGDDEAWRAVGVGDVNGDGAGDVLAGVPGSERGGAEVIYGPISGTVVLAGGSPRVAGESAGDQLGASVAGLGARDGAVELLIGAPGVDAGGVDAGAVYVVSWSLAW